jgi:hypothetical protein
MALHPTTERIDMQTGSYTIAYIATDVAPGLTLDEYRRSLPRGESAWRRASRTIRRAASRYLDDPTGDYETTSGGW